jgi:hypothetical protein
VEKREDGSPVTRSRSHLTVSYAEVASKEAKLKFEYISAETIQTVKLLNTFALMNSIKKF